MAADQGVRLADLDALGFARHQEGCNALGARARTRLREDEMLFDVAGVADPRFGAAQAPAIAGTGRQGRDRRGIRSRLRLGEQKAGQPLAPQQLAQDFRMPGMVAVSSNCRHAIFLRHEGQRRGQVGRAQGLGNLRHGIGGDGVAALVDRDAQAFQPGFAIGLPNLTRWALLCFALGGEAGGELRHGMAGLHQALLLGVELLEQFPLPGCRALWRWTKRRANAPM